MAQAGARAALLDTDWLAHVQSEVRAARAEITRIATRKRSDRPAIGHEFRGGRLRARRCDFARAVLTALQGQGVFVRMPGVAPLDRCIRISCGRPEDLQVLARALPEALRKRPPKGPPMSW